MGASRRETRRSAETGGPASREKNPSPPAGFNFTRHIRYVCADMVTRLPQLAHIDMSRVAISYCQTRSPVGHGLQATLTPMRFEGGRRETVRRGRRVGVQQIRDATGREMLYLLSFYLPRFLNHTLKEKLITILHELWHISPQFDGDLRRHAGRCYVHSRSEREYDAAMGQLAGQWLAADPPPHVFDFLHVTFEDLCEQYGCVYGTRIQAPQLIPLG